MKIAVNGAMGKMGALIREVIVEKEGLVLHQAVDYDAHASQGQDIGDGVVLGNAYTGGAEVLIDFSRPEGTRARLAECLAHNTGVVIGTTGYSAEDEQAFNDAAKSIPVLITSNTSLGVNVVFNVAAQIAKALGDDFDIEVVEKHHRFKQDSPSGTALSLTESIVEATGRDMEKDVVYGRGRGDFPREGREIGVHALRAGDIVGEHTAIFCSLGERIELTSRVHTRSTFARGAVRCAEFLSQQGPGLYGMKDVLGF